MKSMLKRKDDMWEDCKTSEKYKNTLYSGLVTEIGFIIGEKKELDNKLQVEIFSKLEDDNVDNFVIFDKFCRFVRTEFYNCRYESADDIYGFVFDNFDMLVNKFKKEYFVEVTRTEVVNMLIEDSDEGFFNLLTFDKAVVSEDIEELIRKHKQEFASDWNIGTIVAEIKKQYNVINDICFESGLGNNIDIMRVK